MLSVIWCVDAASALIRAVGEDSGRTVLKTMASGSLRRAWVSAARAITTTSPEAASGVRTGTMPVRAGRISPAAAAWAEARQRPRSDMCVEEINPHVEDVMIEVRAAVILLAGVGCGVVTGALMLAEGASWPTSLMAAGAAVAGAVGLLMALVKADD